MRGLRGVLVLAAASAALAQNPAGEQKEPNEARERGRVSEHDRARPAERGAGAEQEFRGLLVDGSCRDRSLRNLRQTPDALPEKPSRENTAVAKEQLDALAQLVPDAVARQDDRTCAITANTLGFALLLENGRLLNLDEGGNTLALQAVQASAAGRAMLNGTAPGLKPRVTITGRLRGDQVLTRKIGRLQ